VKRLAVAKGHIGSKTGRRGESDDIGTKTRKPRGKKKRNV